MMRIHVILAFQLPCLSLRSSPSFIQIGFGSPIKLLLPKASRLNFVENHYNSDFLVKWFPNPILFIKYI